MESHEFCITIIALLLVGVILIGGISNKKSGLRIANYDSFVTYGTVPDPQTKHGYRYVGDNEFLRQLAPKIDRADVDPVESAKFWDYYHDIHNNYNYYANPESNYALLYHP